MKQYWPILKARLLAGEYHPQGARAVDIPKPKCGTRQLGIPSVVDRLTQQALLQQLTPIFDPLFSDDSYDFRPGTSAHPAIETARAHVAARHRWCYFKLSQSKRPLEELDGSCEAASYSTQRTRSASVSAPRSLTQNNVAPATAAGIIRILTTGISSAR